MIELVFIRHGERAYEEEDAMDPLGSEQPPVVKALGEALEKIGVRPTKICSATFKHSMETAEHLQESFGGGPVAVQLELLTPRGPLPVEELIDYIEASLKGEHGCFVLVGHDPRLRQLITAYTGERLVPLQYLDAVCVTAGSLRELRVGKASVAWRYPVRNNCGPELRQKISSKMTVATFLAGFTFTAVFGLLDSPREPLSPPLPPIPWCLPEAWIPFLSTAAFWVLTASVGLFVAAVYVYDQLGMPEGLWDSAGKESWWVVWFEGTKTFKDGLEKNGYVYAYMVGAWSMLFTPAVVLAAIGFGLVVTISSLSLAAGYVLILVGAGSYYLITKPKIGVD